VETRLRQPRKCSRLFKLNNSGKSRHSHKTTDADAIKLIEVFQKALSTFGELQSFQLQKNPFYSIGPRRRRLTLLARTGWSGDRINRFPVVETVPQTCWCFWRASRDQPRFASTSSWTQDKKIWSADQDCPGSAVVTATATAIWRPWLRGPAAACSNCLRIFQLTKDAFICICTSSTNATKYVPTLEAKGNFIFKNFRSFPCRRLTYAHIFCVLIFYLKSDSAYQTIIVKSFLRKNEQINSCPSFLDRWRSLPLPVERDRSLRL
jgi:hypothetical protein